jgi:hypothetical protein
MADAKPADFFLGVAEFFGILLPGAALLYLVQPWSAEWVPQQLLPRNASQAWIVFLFVAYVFGHLLHALSSNLDGIYNTFYLPLAQPEHVQAVVLVGKGARWEEFKRYRLDSTLVGRAYKQVGGGNQFGPSLYDWCLSLVRLQNAAAVSEVDRMQADSKLFRSLSIVFTVALLVTARRSQVVGLLSLAAAAFAFWRYCGLRWVATKRVYEYFLLIHKHAQRPPAPGG